MRNFYNWIFYTYKIFANILYMMDVHSKTVLFIVLHPNTLQIYIELREFLLPAGHTRQRAPIYLADNLLEWHLNMYVCTTYIYAILSMNDVSLDDAHMRPIWTWVAYLRLTQFALEFQLTVAITVNIYMYNSGRGYTPNNLHNC